MEVGYWLSEGERFVDAAGRELALPQEGSSRAVTVIERAGRRVAAIVHDAALLTEPELLDAVTSAARVALERDKLLVEVRARAERYRAVLQAMPDLMFRISRGGRYISFNAPTDHDLVVKEVIGLTTAAGLWVATALGLLIGAGFYLIAIVAAIATVVALIALRGVEDRLFRAQPDQNPKSSS